MQYHIPTCPHTYAIPHTHMSTHICTTTYPHVHTHMQYYIPTCPHTYAIPHTHICTTTYPHVHTHMHYHIPTCPHTYAIPHTHMSTHICNTTYPHVRTPMHVQLYSCMHTHPTHNHDENIFIFTTLFNIHVIIKPPLKAKANWKCSASLGVRFDIQTTQFLNQNKTQTEMRGARLIGRTEMQGGARLIGRTEMQGGARLIQKTESWKNEHWLSKPNTAPCLCLQTSAMATQLILFTLTDQCHGHPILPVYIYRPVPWPPNSSCLHLQTSAMATQFFLFTFTDQCHGHPTHPVYIYRLVPWPPNCSCLHLQTSAMATQLLWLSSSALPRPAQIMAGWQKRCLDRRQCVIMLKRTGSCQGWPVRVLILTQARHSLKPVSGLGDQQTHKPSWSPPSIIVTILKMSEPPMKVTEKLEIDGDCFQRTPHFVSVLSWLVQSLQFRHCPLLGKVLRHL